MLFEKQVDDFPSSSDARNHPVPCLKMSRCFWSERTPVFMPFFHRDLYGIINKLFPPAAACSFTSSSHGELICSTLPRRGIVRCFKYAIRYFFFLRFNIVIAIDDWSIIACDWMKSFNWQRCRKCRKCRKIYWIRQSLQINIEKIRQNVWRFYIKNKN